MITNYCRQTKHDQRNAACPFRDKSDEPPLRYNNISYDLSTRFCHGKGYPTYFPQTEIILTWICVLQPSLQPYENELCSGEWRPTCVMYIRIYWKLGRRRKHCICHYCLCTNILCRVLGERNVNFRPISI